MAKKNCTSKPKNISLALQGGGSHGALTWGILERLSESDKIAVKAITATSAGAMNAVAFAAGMAKGGPQGAREGLEAFWREVSVRSAPFSAIRGPDLPEAMKVLAPWTPYNMLSMLSAIASPYDLNPFDYNPLRDAIDSAIDFDCVSASGIKLFLTATNVETGRARVFTDGEISLETTLASACLPQTFKAIEIEGETYWDGGYMGNPSLFPLIYSDAPHDILIVMLNPLYRRGMPKTAGEIQDRLNEINFNSSLIGELRAIGFVQKLLNENMLVEDKRGTYKKLFMHAIQGGGAICEFGLETKYDTRWSFLNELRERGRVLASEWLETCADKVGEESSVDITAEFLDH